MISAPPNYGLEFLKNVGGGLLVILAIVVRYTSFAQDWLSRTFERAAQECPPPDIHPTTEEEQRLLRGVKRRLRGQTRMRLRFERRRAKREFDRKRRIAFDWFAGILLAYVLLDWVVIPEPYRLPDDRRWPLAVALFLAGTLIIFIGSQSWEGRIGWKKWTFWVSVASCFLAVLCVTNFLPWMHPKMALALLALGGAFFLWLFGTLRRIDRNEAAGSPIKTAQSPRGPASLKGSPE